MPLYEYRCHSCGKTLEKLQKFSDEPLIIHEGCGGELEKLISRSALQFKGSGWYVTDYAKGGAPGNGNTDGDAKGAESKTSEGKSSEGKSDPKTSDSKTSEGKSSDSKSSESKSSEAKSSGEKSGGPSSESASKASPSPVSTGSN